MRLSITALLLCAGIVPLAGQQDNVPIYRVTVERRSIRAINYGHRAEPTMIDFRGTVLLPKARGEAKVQSKNGVVDIDASLEHLTAPTRFGPEYLTYVLWAITPEGRPVNLGEVVAGASNKAKIKVTTPTQAFGLIITAEPYYAVTQPSNVVVLENALRPDTIGKVEEVEAKYELLPRGHSTLTTPVALEPGAGSGGEKVSQSRYEAILALYEAQNALQIARSQGADRYAAETLARAEDLYRQAQQLRGEKGDSKTLVMTAREATQTAEDARTIALLRAPRP
jgi:hypothetical protein